MLNEIYSRVEQEINAATAHLSTELKKISTGRANPALLEGVLITAYGSRTPLQQLASILSPEPLSLVIEPWDKGIIKDIEKGLQEANLGFNPVNEGMRIRIVIPPLSGERREELTRLVGQKAEEARIGIRNIRVDALKDLKKETLSKDEEFAAREKIQQFVDKANVVVEDLAHRKNDELTAL